MSQRTLGRRLYLLHGQWFVLATAGALVLSAFIFSSLRQALLADRLLLAQTTAEAFDAQLESALQGMAHVAVDLATPTAAAGPHLRSLRFQGLFHDAVYLLDAHGEVLEADPPGTLPLALAALPSRQAATRRLVGADGRARLALAQPLQRAGIPLTLVAQQLTRGSDLNAALRRMARDPSLLLFLVDDSGTVIAAADDAWLDRVARQPEALAAQIARREATIANGQTCIVCGASGGTGDYVTAVAPLRLAPWAVVLQQAPRDAFAALRATQALLAAGVLLVALTGWILTRAVSRSIVEPISALSARAGRLQAGDLDTPIAVAGDHEVELLASALDGARRRLGSTLGELRALNDSLESQVVERTRELRTEGAQRKVLVRRLLGAGEEERRRIARELHDEISQLLTVIELSLDRLADDPQGVARCRRHLASAQTELHRIIYDLRPSVLDDLGLAAALRWYAENVLGRAGIDVSLDIEPDLALPGEAEITAFRIYQEIVTNIVRHAGAQNVSIDLYARDGKLVLAVEDDGAGFALGSGEPDDATRDTRQAGAGILGMRERAELVGGSLAIDSQPGAGTQVLLQIPLSP